MTSQTLPVRTEHRRITAKETDVSDSSSGPDSVDAGIRGPVVENPRVIFASRPVQAVGVLLALAAAAEWVPGLETMRLFSERPHAVLAESPTPPSAPSVSALGEARLETETEARPELAQPEQMELPKSPQGPIAGGPQFDIKLEFEKPPLPIVDADGAGLKGFYEALTRTAHKEVGALTRVVHFGDSIVTSDYVSGTLRRRFQKTFGDGGHGFVLIANPWPAYHHNDVYRFASSGWMVSRIVGPRAADAWYGLGGVSFRAPPGARARFGTAKQGSFGRNVSRFELVYLEQPNGGKFALNLDGTLAKEVDASGPTKRVATIEIPVTDGEHELELVTRAGDVRAFGVVMERSGPGVVLDAIGVQGARVRFLDEQDDAHWAEQLKWRKPSLLIYEFGANESGDGFAYPMADYYRTLKQVLIQGKQAVPEAGCLVIGAMDRAEQKDGNYRTLPVIPALVAEQRKASAEVGCAFFDTFKAMGGYGSMANWVRRGLGQADLTHPSGAGSELLANWIYRALMEGFDRSLKGLPAGSASAMP